MFGNGKPRDACTSAAMREGWSDAYQAAACAKTPPMPGHDIEPDPQAALTPEAESAMEKLARETDLGEGQLWVAEAFEMDPGERGFCSMRERVKATR